MKNLKNPNRTQKELIVKRKLDWTLYWIEKQTSDKLILVHKETKERKEVLL